MNSLLYNAEAGSAFLSRFCRNIEDGFIELRAFAEGDEKPKGRHWIRKPGEEKTKVEHWIQNGWNVYIGVAVRTATGRAANEGGKKQCRHTDFIYVEMDAKDYGGDLDAVRAKIYNFRILPSFVIFSGGGYHCYWFIERYDLTTPENRAHFEAVLTALIAECGAGTESKDCSRVLRLAGTWNFKARYDTPRGVALAGEFTNSISESLSLSDFPQPQPKPKPQARTCSEATAKGSLATEEELLRRALSKAPAGRHKAGLWLACQLRDNQHSEVTAQGVLRSFQCSVENSDDHPYTWAEAEKDLRDVYASPPREPWAQAGEEWGQDSEEEEESPPQERAVDPEQEQEPVEIAKDPVKMLRASLKGMVKRLEYLGVKTAPGQPMFPPDVDREDIENVGRAIGFGAERVHTVMNYLWAKWYYSIPKKKGWKERAIRAVFGKHTNGFKIQSEEGRLSGLALVYKRIPSDMWDFGRFWTFYEKLSQFHDDPERQRYWAEQEPRRGLNAEMDAELGARQDKRNEEARQAQENRESAERAQSSDTKQQTTPLSPEIQGQESSKLKGVDDYGKRLAVIDETSKEIYSYIGADLLTRLKALAQREEVDAEDLLNNLLTAAETGLIGVNLPNQSSEKTQLSELKTVEKTQYVAPEMPPLFDGDEDRRDIEEARYHISLLKPPEVAKPAMDPDEEDPQKLRAEFEAVWDPDAFVPMTPFLMSRILQRQIDDVQQAFECACVKDWRRLIDYATSDAPLPPWPPQQHYASAGGIQ